VVIYVLLYLWWGRIFHRLKLEAGLAMLARLLPIWLIFAPFWSDLGYLNVYILMALLATFLIEAVITENLWASVLWAAVILQIKPQWAFMLAVPLLLGQRRYFVKLLLSTAVAYAVAGVIVLLAGSTTAAVHRICSSTDGNWRISGCARDAVSVNHSIAQTVIYLFGNADIFPANDKKG
jgi:hypothetical protein